MTPLTDCATQPSDVPVQAGSFYDVQIEVSFSMLPEPRFQFMPFVVEDGVVVQEDGEIDIQIEGPVRLLFHLSSQSGVEWKGIQLGWFGPTTSDTGGENYEMPQHPEKMPTALSFRVVPDDSSKQSLILEDLQNPPCEIISYALAVSDPMTGRTFRHDPKIYNKGNGVPRPVPRSAEGKPLS